ncbi:uncharacterized protein LAJ45_10492 [Morchella importuna]|uniref:uncharacterized protein n=1 Tax=Morchella importuna TaxID=1174673 RepID=UPI001E8DC08B|nr:uncharacterized protein LAJ45_10492 [Morchella importuna]KAH8145522.1 hypothetical protein LAJ45_10492 [Morchella importuna]
MSSAQRRRLVQDQASLRSDPPPDFFFPPNSELDDLSSLEIYLNGPTSTPFEDGLFLIQLRMPSNYPQEPPKATFKTKIFHPNIDDRSGDVCVGTLKRDWKPSTTLTDVLITIRCLLIYPNPTSSLNAEAGQLLQEDYEGYTRHAKVMTGVHAVVPEELEALANEAKMRGEDEESVSTKAAVMKAKDADPKAPTEKRRVKQTVKPSSTKRHEDVKVSTVKDDSDSDGDSGKENEETGVPQITRPRSPLGKRPSPMPDSVLSIQQTVVEEQQEASGRKSPKIKDGQTPSTSQPKPIVTTSSKVTKSTKKVVKPVAKKVGLKRF